MPINDYKENCKQSLRATSLFGGLQIFKILITIISSKFVAILLGPAGMGILGLFQSTVGLITSFTNLGVATSAVRDISQANVSKDNTRISLIVTVFRKLVWLTGGLGMAVCFILSPYLSRITFGNDDYRLGFIFLSVTLLLTQLNSGQSALLQGMRKYGYLAKAALIGQLLGLFVSIPLYYWKGIDSIVPVLIINSVVSLSLSYYYSKKICIPNISISLKTFKQESCGMVKMGIMISLSGMWAMINAYVLKLFIVNWGSMTDVGLFTAGFAIVNGYIGLIFTAMSTDYYPRLSEVNYDNKQMNSRINSQIEMAFLLISPIICSFIVYISPIIKLVYSSKFVPVEAMIYWAIFGMFFKAPSWAIAYSFLAKGDSKVYLGNEILSSTYIGILNILGFYYGGLTGLGISFMIGYLFYFIQVEKICRCRYSFHLDEAIYPLLLKQVPLSIIGIVLVLIAPLWMRYSLGSILVAVSVYISYEKLNSLLDIKQIIVNRLKKR